MASSQHRAHRPLLDLILQCLQIFLPANSRVAASILPLFPLVLHLDHLERLHFPRRVGEDP